MKNFKKLSALLMASIITAGTVSATTAGAKIWHTDKDKFAQEIESADYYIPENGDWFSNVYLIKRTDIPSYPVFYKVLFMKRCTADPDMLCVNVGQDADIDKVENLIKEYFPKEYFPDVAVEISQPSEANGSRSIQISGYPYYKYTFEESIGMEITAEQARIFCDALSEITEIQSAEFIIEPASPTYATSFLTDYFDIDLYFDDEKLEQLKNYVSKNDWKCHVEKRSICVSVIPDEDISIDEHLEWAKQIERDLGYKPDLFILSSDAGAEEVTIDMHNNIDGDANDDGELAISDAVAIMQSIGNPDEYQLTPQGEFNADVTGNYDGITNKDALTIQRRLLGLE